MDLDHDSTERLHDDAAHEKRKKNEVSIKRNPHPDFKSVEASRPDWKDYVVNHYTKTPDTAWEWGQGGNDCGQSLEKKHIEIDPYTEGRPPVYNYKLMISGIIPRPIGLLGTRSKNGLSTNLAPFSYTNMVCHDPPVFTVGFTGGIDSAKDTLGNIVDTGECVINMVSEHFIEAANATSVNAPYGESEWDLTGLHQAPCTHVRAPRVKESVFAIECKVLELKEFESRCNPGPKTGTLAILEGINFWVRQDAINEELNIIDPDVLRPISRLGGITYGRTTEKFELLRPDYAQALAGTRDHSRATK